ncbi:MAG: isocitrate/isopropylmalate family dehydrogenase, partial [Desulfobacteraceae bacterium]|nr:isocitrate/isopropylmalate family dehydrogenase [Desulfobacteraceae bacterium]
MKKRYNIAVIPGDGTGPEVVAEGIKVLKAISKQFAIDFQLKTFDLGGERYLREGILVSDEEISQLKTMDAIFLGAIGHPDVTPGIL